MQNESTPSYRHCPHSVSGWARGWEAPYILQKARERAVGVDQQAVVKADGLHDGRVFIDEALEKCFADLEPLLALGVAALGFRRRGDGPSVSAAVGRRRTGRHRENRHAIKASSERDCIGAGDADALIEDSEVGILEADIVLGAVVAHF